MHIRTVHGFHDHDIRKQSVHILCDSCPYLFLMFVLFFFWPAAANKVIHPCRIMSVLLLLGALGHRQINLQKISTTNYRYTRPLLLFGIYMQNCKLSELAMPNMQELKFYFL